MCRIKDLVVDLQQESPYFFAAQLKSDSDYGVTLTGGGGGYVVEPLAKFWFLASVVETDSDSGVIRTGVKK